MRRSIILLSVALSVAACDKLDRITGIYCNKQSDCSDGLICDTVFHSCYAADGMMPVDLKGADLHTCEPNCGDMGDLGGGGDAGDLSNVDLEPACVDDTTCPVTAPVCSMGMCGSCQLRVDGGSSAACPANHSSTPFCGPAGACVACLSKDDCDLQHKTCSASTHGCTACAANSDCTSGLCCTSGMLPGPAGGTCTVGECVDKSTLLYVNDAPTAGCSNGGAGSFAQPFCSVQTGLNASSSSVKTVIVLPGAGYPEALTIGTGQNFNATAIALGAVVSPSASPAVSVTGTVSKTIAVTLDGFVFDATNAGATNNALRCNGDGATYANTAITLTRSTVKNAPKIGISSQNNCTLTFDADVIQGNQGGGIKVDTTDYNLTNLLITGNGTAGSGSGSSLGGIQISTAGEVGKQNIFNVTIANNFADTGAGAAAMICAVPAPTTTNTVVFGNQGAGNVEIQAGCKTGITYSAYVGAGANVVHNQELSTCAASDIFVNGGATPFMPKKGGAVPCTLVDDGTNTGAPDHDLVGTARPQPAAGTDDIGCYEAM